MKIFIIDFDNLGFSHEQQRSDRDLHVTIHWDNINFFERSNFDKMGRNLGKYDYSSIMHYPRYAFAVDTRRPTITALKEPIDVNNDKMGLSHQNVKYMSSEDINRLNTLYNCTSNLKQPQ